MTATIKMSNEKMQT